jgi:excisionase family DNA binding protein
MKPIRAHDYQAVAPPEILTVPEAAFELRCSKAHVLNLINGKVHGSKPLPAVWLGRRRVVRRHTLDAWIQANEHS